jgi:hypothetical protein
MPPTSKTAKKRAAETPAPHELNKKQKKQPATPKKAGPILDLSTKLKPKAKDYVDKYLLDLFAQVEVTTMLMFANYQDE